MRARTEEGQKWLNSPVSIHTGSLEKIQTLLPDFERRSFAVGHYGAAQTGINNRLDTIVRKPIGEDSHFIPVGVVSKDYTLVGHREVLQVATRALKEAEIPPEEVSADLTLTEYGERMALSIYLPERFSFNRDGARLDLRLEVFNSVDGSTRFRAFMSWLRLVCFNGLIIGIIGIDVRRRHLGDIRLADVGRMLTNGIRQAERDRDTFEAWRENRIRRQRLARWVETQT